MSSPPLLVGRAARRGRSYQRKKPRQFWPFAPVHAQNMYAGCWSCFFGKFDHPYLRERGQVMPRPRLDRQHEGLTRTEVAEQLGCSPSNIRRLQRDGVLPRRKDRNGIYRFLPQEVAAVAKERGRPVKTKGAT